MENKETYTAFDETSRVAQGELGDVILKIKKMMGRSNHSSVLIFSDTTGKTFDFNFQGSEKEVLKRLGTFVSKAQQKVESGPGRPKLGVISREVTLLPRHWEWLATQSTGASSQIRSLIDEAIKKSSGKIPMKQRQERVYRVMTVLAGDIDGYEEALRALYKRDKAGFRQFTRAWPEDLKGYLSEMAVDVFD
jgi:hypothetical protein